ncbi:MAG TPA: MGMT family protein [Bdellovibrionota bacterium]|nr:MGMT family protein [Bdellovibrionota bacterium]
MPLLNQYRLHTNLGSITAFWNDQFLTRIDVQPISASSGRAGLAVRLIGKSRMKGRQAETPIPGFVQRLMTELKDYVETGNVLTGIPWERIEQSAWTPFQASVYRAIAQIPHGETRTYAWVAGKIGKLGAFRAVGQALRSNPFPILIPCHRVVSSNSLGGFMGCVDPALPELQLKRALIAIEDRYRQPMFPFEACAIGVSAVGGF